MFNGSKISELEARNAQLQSDLQNLSAWAEQYKVMDAIQIASATAELLAQKVDLQNQCDQLQSQLVSAESRLVETDEIHMLQEMGLYQFKHRLEDAVAYKSALSQLRDNIKSLARNDSAVTSNVSWSIGNDAKAGAKMAKDVSKLMLRAYNAEAENIVRTLRPYSLESAKDRLTKAKDTIAKLGAILQIQISDQFHAQRMYELELTADFLVKQEQEKERIREERERQREDEKAAKEFAAEKARLEKERSHYLAALAKLPEDADPGAREELQERLLEIDQSIKGVEEREANVRAGYVYVISNRGAFGEHVVKVGLTRRLDPMDRIRELGDASVPFKFDVHAMIFSEDAVTLETKLHQKLENKRVNLVNQRREFFYATPAEVRQVLEELGGEFLLEYNELPEALEWYESGGASRLLELGLVSDPMTSVTT
jgi:Domain of unknown function (DUF4041)/Meiotically up-regulated gene 113